MKGNWSDIDYTLPAGTALVKAIRDNVMVCYQSRTTSYVR